MGTMTVRELIAKLQEVDPEVTVYFSSENEECAITTINILQRWTHKALQVSVFVGSPETDEWLSDEWCTREGYRRDGPALFLS